MNRPGARRSGRPDAEGTEHLNRLILGTASRLFIEQGYAATSMEQIAAAAGSGKQTLYRRYASKEDLFAAVVIELSRCLREADPEASQPSPDPLATLRQACRRTLDLMAQPDSMAIHRILVAEGLRFPELFTRVRKAAIEPNQNVFRALIRAAQEAGQMRRDISIEGALRALVGVTVAWFLHHSLMDAEVPLGAAERLEFFETAWDVFTRGVVAS